MTWPVLHARKGEIHRQTFVREPEDLRAAVVLLDNQVWIGCLEKHKTRALDTSGPLVWWVTQQ